MTRLCFVLISCTLAVPARVCGYRPSPWVAGLLRSCSRVAFRDWPLVFALAGLHDSLDLLGCCVQSPFRVGRVLTFKEYVPQFQCESPRSLCFHLYRCSLRHLPPPRLDQFWVDPSVPRRLAIANHVGARASNYAPSATAAFVSWLCRRPSLRRLSVIGISAAGVTGLAHICSIRSTMARL
jgi:hypothetical protein